MGNFFSNEIEPENKIVLDASNNLIERDASGNIIRVPKLDLLRGFNLNAVAMLAPIDKYGNRVRR